MLDYSTADAFGVGWLSLPVWLQEDLLYLLEVRDWYAINEQLADRDDFTQVDDMSKIAEIMSDG